MIGILSIYIHLMVYVLVMNKIRMNVFLDPAQKQALEKLSVKIGAPVAELIRRAINAYLKRGRES